MKRLWDKKELQKRHIIIGAAILLVAAIVGYWYVTSRADTHSAPAQAALSVMIGSNADAPRVVVYTDPLCKTCKNYHEETLTSLAKDARSGDLQLEIRPLAIISERSARLTEALMCASDQDAYTASADFIYDTVYRDNGKSSEVNASNFTKENPHKEVAKKLNIDAKQYTHCMEDRTYDKPIAEANEQAYENDVYSTPTTFVNNHDPVRGYARYDYIKGLSEAQ